MPEMHLILIYSACGYSGFTYSACGVFTKS